MKPSLERGIYGVEGVVDHNPRASVFYLSSKISTCKPTYLLMIVIEFLQKIFLTQISLAYLLTNHIEFLLSIFISPLNTSHVYVHANHNRRTFLHLLSREYFTFIRNMIAADQSV